MAKKTKQVGPKVRNKEIRKVRVADLEDAPWNFRTHPDAQKSSLDGTVNEIGYYGYQDCYVTPEGKLRLCDGHLRKEWLIEKYGPDAEIEVNVTDFTEEEARKATLTKDPLAAMAEQDDGALAELLGSVEVSDAELAKLLDSMAGDVTAEIFEEGKTKLKSVEVKKPPKMSWVLVGIPTIRFSEISECVEKLSEVDGVMLETTVNDG